jgi:hypothetical protein
MVLPVDPNHTQNVRDDGYDDFEMLKSQGLVRDKQGRIIPVEKPHVDFSALQRDELYQGYCEMMRDEPSARFVSQWIEREAGRIGMSVSRARAVINEGNGQWPGANMRWWRGLSVSLGTTAEQ